MNEVSVYDITNRRAWQELLDETHSELGLPVALLDPRNIILQSSGERNELCRQIRGRQKALPVICGQSQRFMAKMARTQQTYVVEFCEAGMAKLVVPVLRDQDYLGSITSCGCLLPEKEIEAYLIEKTAGIGLDIVSEMAAKVPICKKEQLQHLAETLFLRLNPS